MPIRQDDNQPNRRFGIVNIILIGVGALLLFSSLFPNQNMQIPRVPYSLFIDQVNDGEVKRAYITQEQIRYELNGAEEGAPSSAPFSSYLICSWVIYALLTSPSLT